MSPSQSSSTSSSRLPSCVNKPRSCYTNVDNNFLKVTKNRKRKVLDKSRFANLDQMQSRGPANIVKAPPNDDIELQYLTTQDLWSDYQRLLQVHRAQKIASDAALEDLRAEISTLGSSLDVARTLHEQHHVSLSEALQQTESMASERNSAQAEVQQLRQACAQHHANSTKATQQAKSTADERDSAQAEVRRLHNELKEAEEDSRRRVDELTTQMVSQGWQSQNDILPDFWPSEKSIAFAF